MYSRVAYSLLWTHIGKARSAELTVRLREEEKDVHVAKYLQIHFLQIF